MDRSKRSSLAMIALAVFIGCSGEETVASKSAAAFREAQERGETFGGNGHAHGHGAAPGGEPAPQESAVPGGEAAHEHEGGHHDAMEHGRRAAAPSVQTGQHAGHGGHAGHGSASRQAPPAAALEASHAGHPPSPPGLPPAPPAAAPATAAPGQPAATLRPDPLDAPAATSVADARHAAALAQEMAEEGHGGHGAGTYRQIDAGRAPAAQPENREHEGHHHDPPTEGRRR